MTKGLFAGFVTAGTFSVVLLAQASRLKPGLWEASAVMNMGDVASMIAEDKLAKMTPEQRAQIQAMMKQAASNPTASKICYTKEQLDKGLDYNLERAGTCKSKTISSTGFKQVSEISCDNGKTQTNGTVTMEAVDPEHYSGLIQMKTLANGQSRDMTIKISGKWLGADCGDVKPHDYTK
jgi:hypothetical protein